MSRYFTMLLLLVVLTTQSAWAMHSEITVQHLDDTHIVLMSNSDSTTVSFESCDHLCHAAAHLLGLLSTCSAEFSTMVHTQKISAYGLNTLFKYQPSIPPPIS